ncbi:PREDICTED: thaumatin-like protein 1b [Nicotiana attenuata]|uniref:Thaumatin-like protein 1 n=1 Tax=Nicotiana attenuata TaxID=49451 RepID=A0A1J6KCX0_NICAT|nr:PREDICTED: thaumatin-like protein 1b [Nicotiana attenuata]OIT19783.1 thaumatin-like protein 1 [Nicotiana attenuata]
MAQLKLLCFFALFLTVTHLFITGVQSSATFTMVNKCQQTIWPGLLSNAGIAPLSTTGFVLQKGESKTINVPSSWGGRFWARTHCTEDSTGKFTCATGDCGSGKLECNGGNAAPPATLAEFTLDGSGGMDFFDVSLVDGYNLPMLVVPQGGSGNNCTSTGCVVDLNGACPSELKVTSVGGENVACKSACEAFRQDEYCCAGAYNSPSICKPSSYSMLFKKACPSAYSFAYDDKTSTFTCTGANYLITFCPSPNTSQKSSSTGGQNQNEEPEDNNQSNNNVPSTINGSMVYDGAWDVSSASSTTCMHVLRSPAMAGSIAFLTGIWQLRHLF